MSQNDDSVVEDEINTIQIVNPSRQPQELVMSTMVTDFARKLFNMLEDPSVQSVVCWGPKKDCFIVRDSNEFSKSVLPRIFNHSNFASFVRQLNKYDFHKVKTIEFNQGREQSATFRHKDFHGDRPDDLQNIKRKMAPAKSAGSTSSGSLPSDKSHSTADSSGSPPYASSSHSYSLFSNSNQSRITDLTSPVVFRANMKVEIEDLKEENEDLNERIRDLEKNQGMMLAGLNGMEMAMAQHRGQMEGLMNLLGSTSGSRPSIPLDPNQPPSASTSRPMSMMTSSTVGPGSMFATTGNMLNPGSLTDQESLQRPQHHRHRGPGQFSESNADLPTVRFSENVDVKGIVGFDSNSPTSPSNRVSIPVFGNLGQVGQATLMQTRRLNQRTAAGPDRDARLWMDLGEEGPFTTSESSLDGLPSPTIDQKLPRDIDIGERSQPQNMHAALSHHNVHAERSSEQLHENQALLRQQYRDGRSSFGLQDSGIPVGVSAGGGQVRQRGRSLDLGDEEFQARSLVVGQSRLEGQDADDSVLRSLGQKIEKERETERGRGRGTRQRRRRGSDSSTFLHRGDRARGAANVDVRPTPSPSSAEAVGSWSFDTTAFATHGVLHGLGIGGMPHTQDAALSFSVGVDSQSPPQDLDADAMDRD